MTGPDDNRPSPALLIRLAAQQPRHRNHADEIDAQYEAERQERHAMSQRLHDPEGRVASVDDPPCWRCGTYCDDGTCPAEFASPDAIWWGWVPILAAAAWIGAVAAIVTALLLFNLAFDALVVGGWWPFSMDY